MKLTSMPPETSTSMAPTAKMPSTMPPRSRSVSVGIDRKPGSTTAATAQKARITPATSVSLRARSSLMRRACARGRPRSSPRPARSSVMRPSFITRMRWQVARSSGRSSEMTSTPSPRPARSRMIPWISAFEPTSTPTVGPFSTSTRGAARQPARQHHPLLVAARERAHRRRRVGRLDRQPPQPLLRLAPQPAQVEERAARMRLHPRDADVAQDRLGQEQPLGQPVLGHVADARRRRGERIAERHGAAVDRHARRHPAPPGRRAPWRAPCARSRAAPRPRAPRRHAGRSRCRGRRRPWRAPAPPAGAARRRRAAPAASPPRRARSCAG